MNVLPWLAGALGLILGTGCRHSHAPNDDHPHSHGSGEHEEGAEKPSTTCTKWTDRYELFVELTRPVARKPVRYHAHLTQLSDFTPVKQGTVRVRFKSPTGAHPEAVQRGVKRPGIFSFENAAPSAGAYTLEMAYENQGQTDTFDCGPITVTPKRHEPAEESTQTQLTFLKESQWTIPFRTGWAVRRPVARELDLPATVEPASGTQLTVAAATGGRFHHNPKLTLAPGLRLKKGDVVGFLAPAVAGEDYSELESAVEAARLASAQTEREIARIEPLVRESLLPERRLLELRNELEMQSARRRSAEARLRRVVAPAEAGGLAVRSSVEGVIAEVLVPNGEPVDAGAPLVRVGGTEHLWLRTRFVARPATSFEGARPAAVRASNGERIDLEPLGARFLSPLPTVDATSRIATWIVDLPTPSPGRARPAELHPGASVILAVRVGAAEEALVVPRDAVVEINTRPYVFVQVDGEHFERRAVVPGPADGSWLRILDGVQAGERVVTRGGFDVHLASLMGMVESHRH